MGVALALLLGALMVRPEWRLPSLVVALLCLPGNLDNIWPQMQLDPNPVPNAVAPVFITADLLLVWALALSVRDRRLLAGRTERLLLVASVAVAALAALSALAALGTGVEPAAVARGIVTFARVPAIVALVLLTAHTLGDGRRLATGFAIAAIGLMANGIYTTVTMETERFTAATFGVNTFAAALAISALVAGSVGLALVGPVMTSGRYVLAAAFGAVGAAALMLVPATGTRMAIIAIIVGVALVIALNRSWRYAGQRWRLAALLGVVVLSVGAGGILSPEGWRSISVVTDPGETMDIVTRPGEQPVYEPARTRYEFWQQARAMIVDRPVTGVGPFQWNVQRYQMDLEAPQVAADPHNTFIQMAAEYGLPVTAAYVLLLGLVLLAIVWSALQRGSLAATRWTATALVAAALVLPLTEMTNSHFFNVRFGPIAWVLVASAFVLSRARLDGGRGGYQEEMS